MPLRATKAREFTYYMKLIDRSNRPSFKAAPTLTAGDFKISKDGGAEANINLLPVNSPSGSTSVRVYLNTVEMTADQIVITAIDPGAEWDDNAEYIDTIVSHVNVVSVSGASEKITTNLDTTISSRSTFDSTTDKVTVSVNEDKTGYTVSTVTDKTGYSLAANQSAVTIGTVNSVAGVVSADIVSVSGTDVSSINDFKATGFSTFDSTTDKVTVSVNEDKTGYVVASGTIDTALNVNVNSISGSAIAASNVASVFTGNGIADDVDLRARSLWIENDIDKAVSFIGEIGFYAAGLTSFGISATALSGNTHAVNLRGSGNGSGFVTSGGTSGNGIEIYGGATGGSGIYCAAQGGNGNGAKFIGYNSGPGFSVNGGATAHGFEIYGGANSGNGIYSRAQGGDGIGFQCIGHNAGDGISATGGAAAGTGIVCAGGANGGIGFKIDSTGSGSGIEITAAGSGNGILVYGGATGGSGIYCTARGGNGNGAKFIGYNSGPGFSVNGGATAHGFEIYGGANSGNGIYSEAQGGDGIGFQCIGHDAGAGLSATGGAKDIDANEIDSLLSGVNINSISGNIISAQAGETFESFFNVTTSKTADDVGNATGILDVNMVSISGSSIAASNVASVFTGTGYTDGVDLTARSLVISSGVGHAVHFKTSAAAGSAFVNEASVDSAVRNIGGTAGHAVVNSATANSDGAAVYSLGGKYGQYNEGDYSNTDGYGVYNYGYISGDYNYGNENGQYNKAVVGYGQRNKSDGDSEGQYNVGAGSSAGQYNQGGLTAGNGQQNVGFGAGHGISNQASGYGAGASNTSVSSFSIVGRHDLTTDAVNTINYNLSTTSGHGPGSWEGGVSTTYQPFI